MDSTTNKRHTKRSGGSAKRPSSEDITRTAALTSAPKAILSKPANIRELVAAMKSRDHASTEAAFDYLAELVGSNIRIRYDYTGTRTRKSNTAAAGPFAHLNGATVHRIMLTSDKVTADFGRELTQQCNGLIMRWPGLEILAMPPPMVNPDPKLGVVFNDLDRPDTKLEVYEINDGTTVNLYWYDGPASQWAGRPTVAAAMREISSELAAPADESIPAPYGRWCLGSANGFEVNNLKMNQKTYIESLLDIAGGDFLAGLNRQRCYSIGFRSHDFHPLLADPERAWIIQSVDLVGLNASLLAINIGGSNEARELEPLETPVGKTWAEIEESEECDDTKKGKDIEESEDGKPSTGRQCPDTKLMYQQPIKMSARDICASNRSAFERFLAAAATSSELTSDNIRYGYIIRGEFAKHKACANVVLESTLLTRIRRSMYNLRNVPIGTDIRKYVVLRAFLSYESFHFTALYPQYRPDFATYKQNLDDLAQIIYDRLRRRGRGRAVNKEETAVTESAASMMERLADIFADNIANELTNVSPFDASCKDLIMGFLRLPQYVNLFYSALIDGVVALGRIKNTADVTAHRRDGAADKQRMAKRFNDKHGGIADKHGNNNTAKHGNTNKQLAAKPATKNARRPPSQRARRPEARAALIAAGIIRSPETPTLSDFMPASKK